MAVMYKLEAFSLVSFLHVSQWNLLLQQTLKQFATLWKLFLRAEKLQSKKKKWIWREFYASSLWWPIVMRSTRLTYNVRCSLKEITHTPGLSSGFFRSMLLTSPRLETWTGTWLEDQIIKSSILNTKTDKGKQNDRLTRHQNI